MYDECNLISMPEFIERFCASCYEKCSNCQICEFLGYLNKSGIKNIQACVIDINDAYACGSDMRDHGLCSRSNAKECSKYGPPDMLIIARSKVGVRECYVIELKLGLKSTKGRPLIIDAIMKKFNIECGQKECCGKPTLKKLVVVKGEKVKQRLISIMQRRDEKYIISIINAKNKDDLRYIFSRI